MSRLSEGVGKKFVLTGEIAPPKGPNPEKFLHEIEELKPILKKLSGINVVDNPGSILLMSSLGGSIMLKQRGIEPIFQLTCRDRNVLAIQADLLSAAAFGIENVLALTGDHPRCKSSDHPNAKPVFELDSCSLITTIKRTNSGFDIAGNRLNAKTNFFIGAALAPAVNPIEPEIYKTKKKLNAGAEFFQTQAVFESCVMEDFLEDAKPLLGDIRKRVLIGIVLLHDYEMLKFLRTIPGVIILDKTADRIKEAPKPADEGVNICLELIDRIREFGFGGAHIMAGGKTESLVKLLEKI